MRLTTRLARARVRPKTRAQVRPPCACAREPKNACAREAQTHKGTTVSQIPRFEVKRVFEETQWNEGYATGLRHFEEQKD